MKLNEQDEKILDALNKARREHDTDMLISMYATLNRLLEKQDQLPVDLLSGFTRGQYKRAIKSLRNAQALAVHECNADMAAEYDLSVQYIRERCLNRKAVQA